MLEANLSKEESTFVEFFAVIASAHPAPHKISDNEPYMNLTCITPTTSSCNFIAENSQAQVQGITVVKDRDFL